MGDFSLITSYGSFDFDAEILRKYSIFIDKYIEQSNSKSLILTDSYFTDETMKTIKHYLLSKDNLNLDPDIHSDTDVSLSMNIDLINLILAICHLKISFILEILQNRIKRILNLKSINEIRDKLGFIDDFLSEEKKYIEMEINEHTNITLEQDLSLSIVLDNSNTMDEIFKASPCNDVVRFLRKKRAIEFIPDETVTNCQNCKNKF